jgi:phosphoribosylformimino-5-aminoimidazole carboxamide ribotide isomerase
MIQRYHDSRTESKHGFELLPAIDLRAGRVVRLLRGDFEAETAYGDDPSGIAREFVDVGAAWLHVVDLDGALAGEPRQSEAVAAIVASAGGAARVQVAGGMRTEAAVAAALTGGAARVVLGTAALLEPAFVRGLVKRHGPASVAVALDVRDGQAVGGGWLAGAAARPVEEVLHRLVDAGVETFMATAIARDGTLAGPDLDLLGRLVELAPGQVFASGGVGALDDLRRVRAIGCAGAIVGRALYEGRFSLAAALAAVR